MICLPPLYVTYCRGGQIKKTFTHGEQKLNHLDKGLAGDLSSHVRAPIRETVLTKRGPAMSPAGSYSPLRMQMISIPLNLVKGIHDVLPGVSGQQLKSTIAGLIAVQVARFNIKIPAMQVKGVGVNPLLNPGEGQQIFKGDQNRCMFAGLSLAFW